MHLPLCLIGDSGTGKSHLLIALGTEAALAGFKVKYTLAAKLVNELLEAADEKALTKTMFSPREETNSVAIASNESFSKAHIFARTCVR
ncbi:ATP-binding protein [Nonomuraea sp. NPDC003709]|uniref:ATP-binding protein n=1 Tax=Nonomuraea sp. NPDC003709 TaxID=3154450 RepID=UPI0033A5594E